MSATLISCLLYTSDAADERSSVDLGGRRIIKKKNNINNALVASITKNSLTVHDTRIRQIKHIKKKTEQKEE